MKWRSLTDSGRVAGDHISSPGWSPAFCRGPDTSTSESAAKNLRLGMSTNLGSSSSRYLTRIGSSRNVRTSRSEEHTSELQSLMRISYAVFCLKKQKNTNTMHID